MALSDEEQRLLEQLEASLAKDDPKLAHTLRGTHPRATQSTRTTVGAALGFAAGLALLVAGIQLHWSISVLGFVVMVVAAIIGLGAWRPHRGDVNDDRGSAPFRDDPEQATSSAFIDRLEERFRRRGDDER